MANSELIQDLKPTLESFYSYCKKANWSGYDPYDVLSSKVIAALPFLNSRFPRLALTQAFKRLPINLRKPLLIGISQNPKVLGVFLSSFSTLQSAGWDLGTAEEPGIVERLRALRASNMPEWCWGYNFPWQGRDFLIPRYQPNIIGTIFVCNGMLDLFERTGDQSLLAMALSGANYILNDLYWTEGDQACGVFYPHPGHPNRIHNATLKAAALMLRVRQHTGEEKFLAPALRLTRYAIRNQQPDGSWYYGESSKQNWVDNFHTGFNLSSLHTTARLAPEPLFEESLRRGLAFYREHFFHPDGSVRYFHDRPFPVDAHCVAQSMITLCDLRDIDPTNVELASKVYAWARKNMWDEKGNYFYYQVHAKYTNRIPYMRWSQAPMFYGLSKLYAATHGINADKGSAGQ